MEVELGPIGRDLDRLLERRARLRDPADLDRYDADLGIGIGMARGKGDRAFALRNRVRRPVQQREYGAEIVMRIDMIGFQGKRPLQARHRFFRAAHELQRAPEIVVRFGIVGLQGDRAAKMRHCFLVPSHLRQEPADIGLDLGVSRLERKRAAIMLERLFMPFHELQRVSQIFVRLGVIRPDRKRLAIVLHRRVATAETHQRHAKPIDRVEGGRIEPNGLFERRGRLGISSKRLQGLAEIAVSVGGFGLERERFAKEFHALLELARLETDNAQIVQRPRMPRFGGKDVAVQARRHFEAALLMQGNGPLIRPGPLRLAAANRNSPSGGPVRRRYTSRLRKYIATFAQFRMKQGKRASLTLLFLTELRAPRIVRSIQEVM